MTDKKHISGIPIPSAHATGAEAAKPFGNKLLSSTSIAPGALVTPTQLAGMLFDSFLANGFFIEAHGQENVLVISSNTLGELGGLNPDTAEKAMDIVVAAIAKTSEASNLSSATSHHPLICKRRWMHARMTYTVPSCSKAACKNCMRIANSPATPKRVPAQPISACVS